MVLFNMVDVVRYSLAEDREIVMSHTSPTPYTAKMYRNIVALLVGPDDIVFSAHNNIIFH